MPNFRLAHSVLTFNQTFRRAAGSCYPTDTRARSTKKRAKRSHSHQPSVAANKLVVAIRSKGGIRKGITRHAKVGGCRGRSDRSERHLKDIGSSPFPPEGRVSMNYAKVIGIIIGTTGHPFVIMCLFAFANVARNIRYVVGSKSACPISNTRVWIDWMMVVPPGKQEARQKKTRKETLTSSSFHRGRW